MKAPRPAPTSAWRTHLLIIFFLFILAPVHMLSVFPHLSTHVLGDIMDTAEYPLNEWWTAYALLDLKTNPFATDYMFFPLGQNLVQHTYTFLDGLFYTMVRPFVSLIVFHNLLIWMTYFANALAAYCLIHYVIRTPWLAFIGALAFGHCPTLMSYYKTASLLELYNFVFFVFFSCLMVQKSRIKWAFPAGLCWGLSLYNYPYYFVFGGLWFLVLLGYHLCPWTITNQPVPESRRPWWSQGLVWASLAGLIGLLVFTPRWAWEFLDKRNLLNWITLFVIGLLLVVIWMIRKFQTLRKIHVSSFRSVGFADLHRKLPGEVERKPESSLSNSSWPPAFAGVTEFVRFARGSIFKNLPVQWNPSSGREVLILLCFSAVTLGTAALVGFPYFLAFLKDEATRQAVGSIPSEFSAYSVDLVSFFAPFNAWLDGLYKIMAADWKRGRAIVGTPAFLGYGFMVILLA
ncbi:MAG: hypothetical protein C0407_13715, partial [Desulfobacca sp.]|nr:hypothetical protein [Desulfobacca sp.]